MVLSEATWDIVRLKRRLQGNWINVDVLRNWLKWLVCLMGCRLIDHLRVLRHTLLQKSCLILLHGPKTNWVMHVGVEMWRSLHTLISLGLLVQV